ncbi:MAG: hypothetical protein H6838_17000 [Planctomycetes bacterium]|nr:hypothetical protein [Planctomycetota bacterium]
MASATKKNARKKSAPSKAGKRRVGTVAGKATKKAAARARPAASSSKKAAAKADPERSSPALAEVDADVLEFIAAIDRFKQQHSRPFPSWSEVLMVVRELGYRRG